MAPREMPVRFVPAFLCLEGKKRNDYDCGHNPEEVDTLLLLVRHDRWDRRRIVVRSIFHLLAGGISVPLPFSTSPKAFFPEVSYLLVSVATGDDTVTFRHVTGTARCDKVAFVIRSALGPGMKVV